MSQKQANLVDTRFGRLVVIKKAYKRNLGNHTYWYCVCDCGKNKTVRHSHLISNATQSCGCYNRELILARSTTHKMSNTPEYRIWRHIKSRCLNPNVPAYKDYGGRGIKICNEWSESFQVFINYVGKRPSPKHTIDRIRNNGHYEPGNVKWSTVKEQNNNRRTNVKLTHNHMAKTYAQWGELKNKRPALIRQRIVRDNWSISRALNTPVRKAKTTSYPV